MTYNYSERVTTTEGSGIICSRQLTGNRSVVYSVLLDNQTEPVDFYVDEISKEDNPKELVDSIVEQVREELLQRSNVGIKKYGVTLDRTDLTPKQWLQHAREEAMDHLLYLTKLQRLM
jgi:hypothetical protein